MSQERSAVLRARAYRRCKQRLGHANGFKPKFLATRIGEIELRVPQVRDGVDFYPSALQKGVRSEKAPMLAKAELYVQGVFTRKVSFDARYEKVRNGGGFTIYALPHAHQQRH